MKDAALLRTLVDLAGLLHDLGKATQAFQDRLRGQAEPARNVIRHEWVSLRLWQAFVGTDDDAAWLTRLSAPSEADDGQWVNRLDRDGCADAAPPFKALRAAPLAQALGWLVVTHHRLPSYGEAKPGANPNRSQLKDVLHSVRAAWNEPNFFAWEQESRITRKPAEFEPLWRFTADAAPFLHPGWRKRASRCARTLLRLQEQGRLPALPLADPYLMHSARLCLMLADHRYSSLEGSEPQRLKLKQESSLWANTKADKRGRRSCNQSLDEHLQGVATLGAQLAHTLPRGVSSLPSLGPVPALARRSTAERFRWQDHATDLAGSARADAALHGAFVVNLASTGCGKTLANARVMQALADPERGMRCAFALGLRSLTLQTGRAFQERLQLKDSQLAVLAGGSAQRALFEHYEAKAEATGSASKQDLLDEASAVEFDAPLDRHPLLRHALSDDKARRLLQAPVLVCTVDHLTPATESERGGRQIAPMLRLMSGDLVLDEPDDFDLADLPALVRLVHWAGLLGARVLLSSATLPPDLVQALFEAYRNGRAHFQAQHPEPRPLGTTCLWLDEFTQAREACPDGAAFREAHERFASQRATTLAQAASAPRRRFMRWPLTDLPADLPGAAEGFAQAAQHAIQHLHQAHHSLDPVTHQPVSFGLLRMANIQPLVAVARALHRLGAPQGLRIHLCAYHSQHTLLVRSRIERLLDAVLSRQKPMAPFEHPEVRAAIDAEPDAAHCFVVLASPVAEVGRDHDYDWAVVEPSSMRSLIQLAGRVLRHRDSAVDSPNVAVFDTNLRRWRQPASPAYRWPGFEDERHRFMSPSLATLLPWADGTPIDSQPRLIAPQPTDAKPRERLSDLEHARLRESLLPNPEHTAQPRAGSRARPLDPPLHAADWWHAAPQDALTTALLPKAQRFRQGSPTTELVLLTDAQGGELLPHRVCDDRQRGGELLTPLEHTLLRRLPEQELPQHLGVSSWGVPEYLPALRTLAQELGRSVETCAEKFGRVNVPDQEQRAKHGWQWHPSLGFWSADPR